LLFNLNKTLTAITPTTFEYRGKENIQATEASIYISNHISLEDISLLDTILPKNVHLFIAKEEEKINLSVLKKRPYTLYEEINDSIISEIKTILQNGTSIFLFPEGSISYNGNIVPIPSEIVQLFSSVDSQTPIIPLNINGAPYIKSSPFKDQTISTTSKVRITAGNTFFIHSPSDQHKVSIRQQLNRELNNLKYFSIEKTNVNLFDELSKTVKGVNDSSIQIKDETASFSYKQFYITVNVLGQKFEKMFSSEERVGILLPTTLFYAITFFSLIKAGKTPALLNFTMGIQNVKDCCENASVTKILTSKQFIKKGNLEPLVDTLSTHIEFIYLEDVKKNLTSTDKLLGAADAKRYKKSKHTNDEVILFTSGSESKPKGVILSHDNIYSNIQQAVSAIQLSPSDKFMNVLPMFHCFGLTVGALLPIMYGLEVFLYASPINYKTIPKTVFKEKSTVLFGTSTFFLNYGKTAEKHYFQSIRYAIAGAEKLKEEVLSLWYTKFGIRLIEGYGATETSPVLAFNLPTHYEPSSVGQLIPGISYKIEPIEGIENGGNLLIKGANVMRGYLKDGKVESHSGWYRTGDVVELNENEHLFIKARLKRFAKLGGEMVSLNLVEQTAISCFQDTEMAAVSISDKRKGEKIILFTTSPEHKEKILKKYIKEQKLPNLLIPAKVEPIDAIPIFQTGKTNYVELQQIAHEKFGK